MSSQQDYNHKSLGYENLGKIRCITLSVSSEIEVIPFTPEDFDLQDPFVQEIVTTGIRLV